MQSVARINRLFGTDGEVMISLYDSFPELVDMDSPLFARIDGLFVPLYFNKLERRGKAGAIVSFDDIDTERRVSELLNSELFLPDEEEFYNADEEEFTLDELIGFSVEIISDELSVSGEITDFIDSEFNPLFEVTIGDNEHLIPAAEEFILAIDFEREIIRITPPMGLLEL
ncbi:MAG: ribosome maturation factor RimM [Rikenellaceae bacterium]